MSLKSKIESLLFVSLSPLSTGKIAAFLKTDAEKVKEALKELDRDLKAGERGVHLLSVGQSWQLATDPANSPLVRDYLKDEQRGELTRPALETLTIIAYRGPIAKAELDIIRGVNCSLILRNLMIKGLIEAVPDKEKMQTFYQITFDFIKFLGLSRPQDLPDYEKLNSDENLAKLLHPEEVQKEPDKEEETPK